MAVDFTEDFEAGPDGAAITSANTAFTAFTGTGSIVFDSAVTAVGGFSALLTTGAVSDQAQMEHAVATGLRHCRFYFQPTSTTETQNLLELRQNSQRRNGLRMDAGGTLSLLDGTTSVATTTTPITAGEWCRIEYRIDPAGSFTLRLFVGANVHGTVPDDEITAAIATSSWNNVRYGILQPTVSAHQWLDGIAEDPVDWVGPANVGGAVTGTLSASTPRTTGTLTGTTTAPSYTATLAASALLVTAAIAGAVTAPSSSGTLDATTPALTGTMTGTVTAPTGSGTLDATLPATTADMAGTVTAPSWTGALDASTPPLTGALSGASSVPNMSGTLTGALSPVTGSLGGVVTTPAGGATLAATLSPVIGSMAGVVTAPTWTGDLAATTPAATGNLTAAATVPQYAATLAGALPAVVGSALGTVVDPGARRDVTFLGFTEHQRTVTFTERERVTFTEHQRTITMGATMRLHPSGREYYDPDPQTDPPLTDWEARFDGATWIASTPHPDTGRPVWLLAGPDADQGTAVAVIADTTDPEVRAIDNPEIVVRGAPRITVGRY